MSARSRVLMSEPLERLGQMPHTDQPSLQVKEAQVSSRSAEAPDGSCSPLVVVVVVVVVGVVVVIAESETVVPGGRPGIRAYVSASQKRSS